MKTIAISSCQHCCQIFYTLKSTFEVKKQLLLFLAFLFLSVFLVQAQQFDPCPNNNNEMPTYSVADSNNPAFGATLELATAVIGPGDDFCIGNDPGKDTVAGCGTFLFTGLESSQDDCPTEVCFSPRQGCGTALGNVCVWIEDVNNPGNWIDLGEPNSSGNGEVCVIAPPGVTQFALTICRPGNGPVSVNDVVVTQAPTLDVGPDQELCVEILPTTIDLTANEPAGQTGGQWSTGTNTSGTISKSYTGAAQSWSGSDTGTVANLTIEEGTIPSSAVITDVNVSFAIDHTWVEDLEVTLVSPDGDTVLVLGDACGNDDNVNVTLDDESGGTDVDLACNGYNTANNPGDCNQDYLNFGATLSGNFKPQNSLSVLDGGLASGTWTLQIVDDQSADLGCIQEFSITVEWSDPLTIIPNPSTYSVDGNVGSMLEFTYTYDASSDAYSGCIISDDIKYTIVDACCDNPINPSPSCNDFKLILVLDESGSIDDAGEQDVTAVKNATLLLVEALIGTGAEIAIIEFASTSSITVLPSYPAGYHTVTQAYYDELAAYIPTGYDPDGATNWEDALQDVLTLNDTQVADIVMFMTDGNPTTSNSGGNDLTAALDEACEVKLDGSHMFALGVGSGISDANLQAISGPIEDDGPLNPTLTPLTADWASADFSQIQDCFQDIVQGGCNNDLELIKKVYAGHDSGAGCPTALKTIPNPNNSLVTYCFTISNNGDQTISNIDFDDLDINIDETDLTPAFQTSLASGASITYYYEYTTPGSTVFPFVNEASVSGETPAGDPLSDTDTAEVTEPICSPGADCVVLNDVNIESCNTDIPTEYDAEGTESELLDVFSNVETCGTAGIRHDDATASGDQCNGGATVTRTYYLTDDGVDVQGVTCSRDFVFTAPALELVGSCPGDPNLDGCSTQADIDAAWSTWISGLQAISASGGCNALEEYSTPINDLVKPLECGTTNQVVSITINGKDDCGVTSSIECTFTVNAYANDLIISDVQDLAVDACDYADQAALDAAFTNWLSGFGIISGGCDPQSSGLDGLTAPDLCGAGSTSSVIWINEFHYDNDGGDTGEFVEVAGTAGLDLTGYSVEFYNGATGALYSPTLSLAGTIDDEGSGFGALSFLRSGIQNGSPDGMALITPDNSVIEFISYEGSFMATSGNANGMSSTDVGVSEPSNTPIGQSLQKTGTGSTGSDFAWTGPDAESPGSLNSGQTLMGGGSGNSVMVTFNVTDLCENGSDTATFTVNPLPVLELNCPADATVECVSDIQAGTATLTTSCAIGSTISASAPTLVSGQADCDGATYEIVYTVTDDCGRQASCTQTFTIDNDGPTIVCPADATVECAADIQAGTPTVTTSCGLGSTVDTTGPTLVSGQADCDGATYEIVYTVTDDCGREASCTQTFTIDNDGPTITCPADATVECVLDIMVGTPTVTTSCGLGSTVDTTGPTLISGQDNADGAMYEIVYTVTDDCGREASCTQTFTIDNDGPTIMCPADATVECAADIEIGTPTTSSSCGLGGTVSTTGPTLVSGQADCDGATYEIVYTVTDATGRESSCTQTFTIDNDGPTIVCPADATVECAADIQAGTPTVTTSCGLGSTVGTTGPTLVSGQADCDGATYEIVYTVTDDCGRQASCTQTFTIDNDGPTIVCPADATVECASDIQAGTPTVTTSCGLGSTVGSTGPTLVSGQADCDGATYEIVYTVTDDCGRQASCTQTFTIDNDGPTIVCPADATVECAADIVESLPSALSTSCGLGATVNTTGPTLVSGLPDCKGSKYEIVYTITDDCGREASCTQTFTIDNEGPTITCPADATIECVSAIEIGTPTITTSCGLGSTISTLGPTLVSGVDNENGAVYEVMYTVEDDCGRTASCIQTFTIDAIDAGEDGDLLICVGDSVTAEDLFEALNGTPDEGGVWSPDPAGAGIYEYIVGGTDPCPDAIAQVIVSEDVIEIIPSDPVCGEGLEFGTYSVDVMTNGGALTSSDGDVVDNGNNSWSIINIPNGNNISVTVTTDIECESSIDIIAPDCICIELDWAFTNVTCFGENDGTITVNFVTEGAVVTVNGLPYVPDTLYPPGIYTIEAYFGGSDDPDCYISETFEILEPEPVNFQVASTDASCHGAMDGTITVTNLTENAVYVIQRNGIGPDLSGQDFFDEGLYIITATVSDEFIFDTRAFNPCIKVRSVIINAPKPLDCEAIPGFYKYPQCDDIANNFFTLDTSDLAVDCTFQWSLDANALANGWEFVGNTTGETVHFNPGTGVAMFTATIDGGNCSAISQYETKSSCFDPKKGASFVDVYPNPVKDVLTVDFGKTLTDDTRVEVFDLTGNKFFSRIIAGDEKASQMTIDFSEFLSNVYYLKISSKNGIVTKKVILDK